jgi:hypothetical protein
LSIGRALAARGYEIDPAPWGKVVRKILVFNEPPLAEDNWLKFFNHFHYTTRERAIRDELTIHEGQLWDDDLVAESGRRLHQPLFSTAVALVPVRSPEPGTVDLLVVTRDVWSLRANSNFTIQESSLTYLAVSLSENNFLGNRDVLSATMVMDQGSIALGPRFLDQNVLGSHWYLYAQADEIITRQRLGVVDPNTGQVFPTTDPKGIQDGGGIHEEGHDFSIQLNRPLWSLATEWGGGASFAYSDAISRTFQGLGLFGYEDPNMPGVLVARQFRAKQWSLTANAVRQWGTLLKQQLTVGYQATDVAPSLVPDFPANPVLQADFIRDVFPKSELLAGPYVEYSFFRPRYETVRYVGTYEFAEDLRIGPDLDVSVQQGMKTLGSKYTFTRPTIALGWTFAWGNDGFVRPSVGASMRLQSNAVLPDGSVVGAIDSTATAQIRAATPGTPYGRLVAQAYINTRWHDTQNQLYYIGGDPNLRGYEIDQFYGYRLFSGQLEARTMPFRWWVFRLGGVLFYDVGGAANSLSTLGVFHDVGIGVRTLFPQTSSQLIRFDLAFPLQATVSNGPALIPHGVISFGSAF